MTVLTTTGLLVVTAVTALTPVNAADRSAGTAPKVVAQNGLAAAPASISAQIRKSVPSDDAAKGLVYSGLEVSLDERCGTGYVLASTKGCTHGPDAPPGGKSLAELPPVQPITFRASANGAADGKTATDGKTAAATSSTVPCYGDGSDGNRIQVLYVYSGTNRFSEYQSSFEEWAAGMDTIVLNSAAETGGVRHLRFVTQQTPDGCVPIVTPVQVTEAQIQDLDTTSEALKVQGYDRQDRKYVMFADSDVYCGIGQAVGTASKSPDNPADFGPSYARADAKCWDSSTATHELGHILGAVQPDSPNGTESWHCLDEWDIMCYSSSSAEQIVTRCPDDSHNDLLDCNHDDYFSTNPAPGSYLATHYNMADNVFLTADTGTASTPSTTDPPSTPEPPLNPEPPSDPEPALNPQPALDLDPPAATDPTITAVPETFRLQNSASDLCLAERDGPPLRNAPLHQVACDRASTAQQFGVLDGKLVVRSTGRCVSVLGTATTVGAQVVTTPCSSTDASQQIWTTGKFFGFRSSNLCLDVRAGSVKPGATFVQQTCDARASQGFTLA